MSSKKPSESSGLPRYMPNDPGWDAPDPTELPASRSGAWTALGKGASPNVARMGNPHEPYLPETDTEETPATAHPGQYRFDDLFDDDEDEEEAAAPTPPADDDTDDDAAFAAVEAEISAARLARLDAVPVLTPPPAEELVPDAVVASPTPAPMGSPPPAPAASKGMGVAGWLMVALAFGGLGAAVGYFRYYVW